jgi:hypothetical protein
MASSNPPRRLPLARGMASVTEHRKVALIVCLKITSTAEFSKRADVMNVQRATKLLRRDPAILTRASLLANLTAHLAPIRAVVRLITTTPIWSFSARRRVDTQPLAIATARTEAPACPRHRCREALTALLAYCLVGTRFPSRDVADVGSTSALVRAVDARPRFHERERGITAGTSCRDARSLLRLLVAGHPAVRSRAIRVALERFATARTRSCGPAVFETVGWHLLILLGFASEMEAVKYA